MEAEQGKREGEEHWEKKEEERWENGGRAGIERAKGELRCKEGDNRDNVRGKGFRGEDGRGDEQRSIMQEGRRR